MADRFQAGGRAGLYSKTSTGEKTKPRLDGWQPSTTRRRVYHGGRDGAATLHLAVVMKPHLVDTPAMLGADLQNLVGDRPQTPCNPSSAETGTGKGPM